MGSIWYGPKYLFGSNTQYVRGTTWLAFSLVGDYTSGNEVTLYKVPNGNFHTEAISAEKF
jgi:hypothetical protein